MTSRAIIAIAFAVGGLVLVVMPVATLAWPSLAVWPALPEIAETVIRIAMVLVGANMVGAAWGRRRDIMGLLKRPRT